MKKIYFTSLALLMCLLTGFATTAQAQETDDLQAYLDQLAAEHPAQQPTGHRPVRRNNPPEPPTSYATVNLSQFDSYQNRTKVLQVKSNVKFVNGIISAASSFSGGTPLLQVMSSAQVIIDETSGVNASATNSQACTSAVSIEGSSTLFQYAAITAPANGTGVAVNIASSGSALVCGGTVNGQINNPGNGTIYYFEGPTEAYAVLSTDHKTLSFYYDGKKNQRTGTIFTEDSFVKTEYNYYWGDWSNSSITTVNIDPTFADYDGLTSTAYWFFNCYSLTTINGLQYLNTANVTDMSYMFGNYEHNLLTSLDVSNFNTAKVTNMVGMFMGCSSLTSLDLSSFNTANVTNMRDMFWGCSSLTSLNVGNFNTVIVTDMHNMFEGCSSLTSLNLNNFNTANVTDMAYMFCWCSGLTSLDLSSFNTANVTNMGGMFSECSSLTSLNVGNFNTAIVTDMHDMFEGCSSLTSLNLNNFNTANVTDMAYMFYWCFGLTSLDLSSFNTANVTNMKGMFYGCSGLTTIQVSDQWTTDNVSSSALMFSNCTSLVGGDGTTYDPNYTDKTKAYAGIGGYLTMKGQEIGVKEAYAVLSSDGKTLSFYYDEHKNSQVGTIFSEESFVKTEDNLHWGNNYFITTVNIDPTFADYDGLTSTAYWFYNCMNLTTINGLQYLNTANVTDMSYMFGNYFFMTSLDVPNFNTAKVTNLGGGLTSLDLSSFHTANVTNMSSMFSGCSGLTNLDLSSFNTANVTNMSSMFSGCSGLTNLDLSSFNTAKVTNMFNMFDSCYGLTTLDLSSFNTANVTNMSYMFSWCSGLTSLDLSSFNTANVTSMSFMFSGCSSLTSIYISDQWTTDNVSSSTGMFYDSINLIGGDGTAYNPNYKDKTKAYAGIGGYLTMEGQNDDDLQNYLDMLKIDMEDWWSDGYYHRQFYTDCWQTLYVPFTMSYSEWKDNFEVARLIGCDQYDTNGDGINDYHELMASVMGSGSTTSANHPYLIRAKAKNATLFTLNKQEGDKYADSHVFTGGNFQYIAHGNYGLQADMHGGGAYRLRGGAFTIPESDEEVLPPYRWFLTVEGPEPQQVVVRIGGEATTSIGASSVQTPGQVFDLQGRKMTSDSSRLKPGIYVVNGKKQVVR